MEASVTFLARSKSWGFPKIRSIYPFRGPYNEDYSIRGPILASHNFEKLALIDPFGGFWGYIGFGVFRV